MKKRDFVFFTATSAFALPAWLAAQTKGMSQTALVIGNNAYQGGARLVNATNDARLMHETFGKLGAQSVVHTDLTNADMTKEIEAYAISLRKRPVGISWFFFSGHGVYIDGKSLLLGIDISLKSPEQLKSRAYDLDKLKGLLDQVKPQVAIIVVDACRDNPFLAGTRGLIISNPGLVPRQWGGALMAYSTAPYTRALDWPSEPNGPYAKALSKALLARPPRLIEDAFKAAADEVYAATAKEQKPGYYSELRSKVLLDASQTSISPGSILDVASASIKPGQTAARSYGRTYRADLRLDDKYAGISKDDWDEMTYEQENAIKKMDRFEAADVLARAGRPGAVDKDLLKAGMLQEQGLLVTKNRKAAATHYEKAALRGYVPAQTMLGELEYDRQNYAESYKWLSQAASSGWGRPVLNLAQLNLEGKGVAQDSDRAMNLLREAFNSIPMRQPPVVPNFKP